MYGLTDNIVAGPAGHTTAGPAGHFEAGPAGSFTPGPAGQVPISDGGYVPIDCTPAVIPYAAPSGGILFTEGSTQSPIPSTGAAHGMVSPGGGGGPGAGGGGAQYLLSGGGFSGGGGGGVSVVGGGGISGGGGGISIGGGGGGVSGGGVSSGGGGGGGAGAGVSISGGSGSGGGGGGGASGISYVSGGGGVSYILGGPSPVAQSTGGGITYSSYFGPGMAPVELRVGQAMAMATGSIQPTPSTEGFTVSPGGRTVPTPTGYVHPPQAAHFHGSPQTHVAHHPTQVFNHTTTTEAWTGYHAAYVWTPPQGSPPPAFLAGDYLKPSTYDPPKIIFPDEAPRTVSMVDASVSGPRMQVDQATTVNIMQDYSQSSSQEFTTNNQTDKTVTVDYSETRNQTLNMPENREVTNNIDMSQTSSPDLSTTHNQVTQVNVEDAARVLNMFFIDSPQATPAEVTLGGPVVARVG
ncbi:MAG: hypothetical protein HY916_03040 [Desulfovibrio sp.]|nr:hypothetical protein [Desulfovibrio sp.]